MMKMVVVKKKEKQILIEKEKQILIDDFRKKLKEPKKT